MYYQVQGYLAQRKTTLNKQHNKAIKTIYYIKRFIRWNRKRVFVTFYEFIGNFVKLLFLAENSLNLKVSY